MIAMPQVSSFAVCSALRMFRAVRWSCTFGFSAPVCAVLLVLVQLPGVAPIPGAGRTVNAADIPLPSAGGESVPLHQVINNRLRAPDGIPVSVCSDAEFLRRVSLDLTGMPPLADEARAFIGDTSPDKRTVLVDRLLESPQYGRHLASTLDVMLMERRANTGVGQEEWLAWLLKSVRENKPWNVLVREILSADGDDPALRAPARFYVDRGCEPNVIARDLGRIFFGRDLQCAQCHDSPLVSDFLQIDYQGLLAFTAAGYEVKKKHGDKDVMVYAERSGSDLTFESVFNKGTPHRSGARLPGMPTVDEPFFYPGEEYAVAPADTVRAVPKFSRRAKMVELATGGANSLFNVNIVNRLWYHMLGRGLVHPLDMIHPDNPAPDPELLQYLGQRFAEEGFNMKSFLRELALSEVYQRPFDLPMEITQAAEPTAVSVSELTARRAVLDDAGKAATAAYDAASAAYDTAEAAYIPVGVELDTVRNAYAESKKKSDEARKAMQAASALLTAKQKASEALQAGVEKTSQASQLIADDKEVADLLARLTTRTQQIVAELPALQKGVEEKTAALVPLEAAQDVARQAVEGTLQKAAPLREALRTSEQAVVVARAKAQELGSQVVSVDKALAVAQRVLSLQESANAASQLKSALGGIEAEISGLNTQVVQRTSQLGEMKALSDLATQKMLEAESRMAAADKVVQQRVALETTLSEALASLQAAQLLLAGEDEMVAVVSRATQRVDALRAESQNARQILEQAVLARQAAVAELDTARAAFESASAELAKASEALMASQLNLEKSRQELAARQQEMADSMSTVATDWSGRFLLSSLKPLTPEQLCWTVFRVTTVYDRYAATEAAELEKSAPLTEEQKADTAVLKVRSLEIEQRTFDKLKGNLGTYVQFYGGGAGQPQGDFYASADQALFVSNGGAINSWVVPAGDNAAERIVKASDPRVAAEELYLGILTRMPSEEEVLEVTEILASRQDRSLAAQELVWGLLNSAEFRFNH